MSYYLKAKMHQIRFPLGLRWRCLQCCPDPLAEFNGGLLLREGLGRRTGAWASAHRGKWGQLTPLEKWMKNKISDNMKKGAFF